MGKNKENSVNQKEIIMRILILILIVIIVLIVMSIIEMLNASTSIEEKNDDIVRVSLTAEEIQENEDREELEKVKAMKERNRIEYYITKFINYAENGEYEEAYRLLNKEYKEKYFPTESDFREYAKETFTSMLDVKYTNLERNGDIYVSWVTLTDSINGTKDSGKEFNFVVKEKDFNDYELSFSKN